MYVLYSEQYCPYCHKVRDFIKTNHIKITLIDRDVAYNRADLIAKGGKAQVPYLIDQEASVEMYESDDIIAYLRSKT